MFSLDISGSLVANWGNFADILVMSHAVSILKDKAYLQQDQVFHVGPQGRSFQEVLEVPQGQFFQQVLLLQLLPVKHESQKNIYSLSQFVIHPQKMTYWEPKCY